jgi:hypothetical protein
VLPRTMGGCKPLLLNAGQAINDRYELDCSRFNSAVLRSLEDLRPPPGSRVVLAARWNEVIESDPATWVDNLQRTTQTLRALGVQVLLAADVPTFPWGPNCVARRGELACRITRESVDAGRTVALEGLKRVARNVAGVSVWDPIDDLCDQKSCSPIRNGIVTYADAQHLSRAGSLSLVDDAP